MYTSINAVNLVLRHLELSSIHAQKGTCQVLQNQQNTYTVKVSSDNLQSLCPLR
jgi:hypothetical protein